MSQETMTWPSPTKAYHTSTYASIDPSLPALSARGKNVVITGGGSGIGPQIAEAYATASASNIALLGRTEATLKDTKSKIEGLHPSTAVSTYVADITDSVSLERAFAAFAQHVEGVHVLVANAGFLPKPESVAESSLDEWFRGFEINVKGNFNLIRAFLPHAAKDAAILNISTGVVHLPYLEKASGYHTSKLAAAKMFDYVRVEHPGFFVLNIHPGVISTAMDDKNEASRDALPHDDIQLPASFVVWAVSPEAKFLNGKFVWAHWDVDELKTMATQIESTDKFTLGLLGWP